MISFAFFFFSRFIASRAMACPSAPRPRRPGARRNHCIEVNARRPQRAIAHAELLVRHAIVNHVDLLRRKFKTRDDLVRDEMGITNHAPHAAGREDLRLQPAQLAILRGAAASARGPSPDEKPAGTRANQHAAIAGAVKIAARYAFEG